jgi:alpha-L-rhamnosidase
MMTSIVELLCEYRTNPLGIDVTTPRLSWQMQTERSGARQTAYRILAANSPELLRDGSADLWDSGKVESDQSIHVVYAGSPLQSRQRAYWSVIVWDELGNASQSEPGWFEIGLLHRDDWRAEWVGAALRGGPRSTLPAPYLRKAFTLPTGVKRARLYVTALGLFECSINGQRVGEDVLTPGWTDFHKRVRYMTYDVTSLLKSGENALGAILGDGWAVGHVAWNHRQLYADRPRLFAQLEITLADGKTIVVSTDSTWKYNFGAIASSDLLMGEDYDARLEMPGWDQPGFDDARWYEVEVFDDLGAALVAANDPTVRPIQEVVPISDPVDKSSFNGKRYVFDLGQNMVGRARFKGSAPAGTTITLRFSEVLNPDGTLYTTNLRSARATDYYTFTGDTEVVWEPKFTFHGFRYVELQNYPGEVSRDTITGVVLHSDMTPSGEFECSDPLINQLQHNIAWGQKGNFVDVPTDCPQRDERLGWTGDIQVFVRTAAFNMNVAGFMTKWAQDVADAQTELGIVPPVVPKPPAAFLQDGGPAWADAAIICPWTIYLCYGDKRILETSYATMSKFMDFLVQTSPGLIRCAPEYEGWHGFGDWLSINAKTPRDLIGTAFFAYDASLMAQIATILGKPDDSEKCRRLFDEIKAAFAARFLFGSHVTASSSVPSEAWKRVEEADRLSDGTLQMVDYGTIESEVFNTNLFKPTQTAYVLALNFDLLPEAMRPLAVTELVADIERRGNHLSTGFVGSPYLPHVLSKGGRSDVTYELLHQTSWPSWLYSVTQGATTIWERWDGWTSDRGFQTPEMNSFNHYAYGAIGAWLYNTVAGIEPDPGRPGYKHTILHPQPGGGLTSARGRLRTLYGEVISQWEIADGKFRWTVVVPPNTTATAYLPVGKNQTSTLDNSPISGLVHELQAGEHQFVVG